MPKYLYLLRHAESVQKHFGYDDKDRDLTANGIKESMQIANFLQKSAVAFDLIISSSSARTRATTEIVSDGIKTSPDKVRYEDELYEDSMRTFFDIICNIEDHENTVMCVGHNPTISYLAEYLTSASISEMPPAGLAIIKINVSSWREVSKGGGELSNYVYPSMLDGQ